MTTHREVKVICSGVHGSRTTPLILGRMVAPERLVPLSPDVEVERIKRISYLEFLRENRGAAPPEDWDPLAHVSDETREAASWYEQMATRVRIRRGGWHRSRRGDWIHKVLSRDVAVLAPDGAGDWYQIRCRRCRTQVVWREPELALRLMYAAGRHADLDLAAL